MKICITLDDVIRAKSAQIGKIYKKYIDPDIDLDALDLSSGSFAEILGFNSMEEYNEFLYANYGYEIFAEAPVTERMIDKNLNLWHIALCDDYDDEVEISLANPFEFNQSIGFTCFFLSKIATRIRKFYFPTVSTSIWDKCDVLVTADKTLLEMKPEGKKSIKIKADYNKDIDADFAYDKLSDFLNDKEIIKTLLDE